jgi:predicted nucleotidyltransferase component of viral defense system
MTSQPKNIALSNRAKLLNISREKGPSFQELVQYFAMFRFIYRMSISDVASRFILKGALLLHAQDIAPTRSTFDIDLLGQIDNSREAIAKAIKQIIDQDVEPDGLEFHTDTIVISDITRESGYAGSRVNFKATLDTIRIPMQIDIGFGDKVIPEPVQIHMPSLIGYPSATLRGYAFETSIAEKTHVMFQRELLNSRMKDFYDIWLLLRQVKLNQSLLGEAIAGTFTQRRTEIPMNSILFTDDFLNDADKQKQWAAFRRKRGLENAPQEFAAIAKDVLAFLKPALDRARMMLH